MGASQAGPEQHLGASSKGKVLIIDDDPIVLEVARERLQRAGYEAVTRQEALGTVQTVRDEMPDLVLLDVMMPALTGERIASLLMSNARTGRIGVVLHSSKSDEELSEILNQTQALGAISKACDETEFLRRFEELARRHREQV